jgi:hypothetical protein
MSEDVGCNRAEKRDARGRERARGRGAHSLSRAKREKSEMLRIYPVTVETLRGLRPFIERIEKKDGDLCR